MAEVILPPEETEPEVPEERLPEVEKPTEKSKVISVDFNPLNTKQTASLDTRESFYTTDTDAWIVLNVGDMNEPTGQYSLALINKEDGSIFQRVGDIVQGVAYYKLLPNEIKHAGRWVGQAVIALPNGRTTASRFSFNVSGHILDGKDVREVVIQDFQTLMAQLNDLKDNSTNEFGILKNEIEVFQTIAQENENERKINELSRAAAEINREENYESKVTAAIVEADVVEKVDNKVAELAPTIQQVTAQLAHNDRTPYISKQVQNTSNKPKPIVVFTFDDGAVEDINLMKPLFDEFGYKFTTYIVPNFVGTTQNGLDYMNKTQLKELYDDGHEIGSHTMNHLSMSSVSEEVVDYEMRESKKVLTEWGFEVNNFSYPFGQRNNLSGKIALKYFRTATLFNSAITPVTIPIKKVELERKSLGSYPDYTTSTFPVTDTFQDYYKYWVDDAINNNRLTVFALHPWKMPNDTVQMGYLRDVLQYCKDNNVSVMTLNKALDYFDNQLDFKVYNSDDTVKSEIMFDANGELSSGNMIFNKKIQGAEARQLNQNSLPADYPMGYTRLEITDGTLWTLYGGNVVVYTDKANTWADGVRQWIHQRHGTAIKYRSAKADGTWTEFVDIVSTGSTRSKFVLNGYKPIASGFNLAPYTTMTYDVPNSALPWTSIVVANVDAQLPKGIVFSIWNAKGLGCKLEIANTSPTEQWIANTTQFNIKEV